MRESQLNGPCLILVAIAAGMLQISLGDRGALSSAEWIHFGIVIVLSWIIYLNTPWQEKKKSSSLSAVSVCTLCLIVLPFVYNSLLRASAQWGYLFDIQVALLLRNMMFGLVAVRAGVKEHKLAALASCFVVLFSTLWLMDRRMASLLFIYTLVGMWWLMGTYWERISGCFLSGSERYIPWKPLGAASGIGVIGLLLLVPLTTGVSVTTAINGFMPSSGGTRWQDEYAIGGIGDGPQMVRAKENASTFGPIESDLFLESKMPSLYDVFNDMYGEPPKPSRKRAIPLSPSLMQENHKKLGQNQKSSREFSVVRRGKEKAPDSEGSKSPSLIQVAGRVPAHLGLYSYDMWDGNTLSSSGSAPERKMYLDKSSQDGRDWARYIDLNKNELLSHYDRHELRIINLKTARVPATPNLTGVHIDELHTESFFKVKEDGMLSMDMDFIPQLSVLHIESLQRKSSDKPILISSATTQSENMDRIGSLARQWTSDLDDEWQKAQRICQRLREDYTLDPQYVTPEETEDAALHFLFDSKRGPDHHFAISAALLLRSLGHEARVISGLYADPKNYERASRLTSVYAKDAHFWVEVLASSPDKVYQKFWLPLEPTPGYRLLLAPESLWSQLINHAAFALQAMKRNPVPTIALIACCLVMFARRALIGDLLITSWWEMHHRFGDQRHRIISTLRLLKRRSYLHGTSHDVGTPVGRWNLSTPWSPNPNPDSHLSAFKDLANWALYGEGVAHEYANQEVVSLCREAATSGYPILRRSNTETNKLSKQEIR